MFFEKFMCKWKGHKRGKRLKPTDAPHVPGDQNVSRFQCPRCLAIWTRAAKKSA